MSTFWSEIQSWKILPLLAFLLLPFFSLSFLSGEKKFDWSKPRGVVSHVKLFIQNENGDVASPAAASISLSSAAGGGNLERKNFVFQQVSTGVNGSPNTSSKLALVAKFPLISIDNSSTWEYCIPEVSPLKSTSAAATSSQAGDTRQSSEGNCELKTWSYETGSEKTEKNGNSETIKYLLELISKFIRLQHQVNMIYLFHSEKKDNSTSVVSLQNGTQDESWKSLKSECGFQEDGDNKKSNIVQEMLLSSLNAPKKCLPFPLLVEIYLKLKQTGSNGIASAAASVSASPVNNSITVAKIKQGEMWGQLSYGLTNYWGQVKKLRKPNGSSGAANGTEEGAAVILVPLLLNYDLSDSNTSSTETAQDKPKNFNALWKKYTERTLRLCDYKKEEAKKS